MSGEWRWADPRGQQRLVRQDELRAALADGVIPPNAPVWKPGWKDWVPASDVPELMSHALAAANGLVPNVPPLPLFVVAAQSEYESHTPDSRAPSQNVEPPPPPRYVPIPAHSSQPQMQAVAQPDRSPPAAAVQAAVTQQASKKAPAKKKQTMLGIAPPGAAEKKAAEEKAAADKAEKEKAAPVISASAATGTSGAEQLKRGLPTDAPPSSRFGVAQETKAFEPMSVDAAQRAQAQAQAGAKATVVGVPAIEDPRNKPPSQKPPPPAESALKRPTLILYGGAPQAEDAPTSVAPPTAPPIVAPAPGAPVAKNSVTQAPPWDQGAVELGPAIPKSAKMPAVEKVEPDDEISESLFIESTDEGPKLVPAPGAKRPSSMPPPLKPRSIPPPMPGSTAITKPPEKGRTQRPPPFVPHFQAPPEGGPPPPTISLEENASAAPEPLATSDVISTNEGEKPANYDSSVSAAVAFRGPSFLTYVEPLVAKYPKLGPTRDKLAKFEEGKPRFLLPLLAGLTVLIGLLFFVIVLKAIFGGGDSSKTVAKGDASATPSASAAPSTTAATTATATATQSAAPVNPPPTTTVSTTPCSVVGSPKTIFPKALVPTGVEVVAGDKGVILGFASGPKDGAAIALNPSSLSPIGQTKTKAGDALKRVEPLPIDGHPQVSANVDKKSDALQGRRTVPSSPAFDLGVADGSLAWATRGSDKTNALWTLAGSGPVEALRGVPLDGGTGIAIAYRRAGAIWLGVATGEKTLSAGNLSSTQGLGPQVGSPAIASSGNAVLAIWADRASASDAWGLRLQRWKVGETPTAAESFVPPAGGLGAPYMSPGVASLTGGRFLVVWTEGPAQGHQVRAITIGPDGAPQGDAITVSAEGENAGQGQAAVTPDGKGVVGYLVSSGPKGFAVAATAITCPK
ncbi:MAG TPA: GYF domain-containing protein [Polyangiaceae bacterium]